MLICKEKTNFLSRVYVESVEGYRACLADSVEAYPFQPEFFLPNGLELGNIVVVVCLVFCIGELIDDTHCKVLLTPLVPISLQFLVGMTTPLQLKEDAVDSAF